MPHCGHVPAGIHQALVLAIVTGIIGLGSLTAALVAAEDTHWAGVAATRPAQPTEHAQPPARQTRSVAAAMRPRDCGPEPLRCAAHSPVAATAEHPAPAAIGPRRPEPGERELFLTLSASLARRRVRIAESVPLPPQMQIEMIAATSPNP